MATVGLNFGSASSGQGFDVAGTVSAILATQSAIETPLKTQLTALTAQDAIFSTLGADLSTLTTSVQALTDFSGVLAQKQGSSSATNLLALTSAGATATAGSHTITVNGLAQTSSNYSDTIASAGDTLSGSLTIQVGSGAAQTITVDSTSNTLRTLSDAINHAGAGVTASVLTDANGSRLSLVSSTGGSGGQLTVSSALNDVTTSAAIASNSGQTGQNASLVVDGVSLSSTSNTVSTAIPGVTFQLLAADANTHIQVQIANDTSAISAAVQTFVSSYNKVVKDISGQEGKDANGNPQPLYGDATLSQLQTQLTSALLGGSGGASGAGTISSIAQIGLSLNNDGTLTLNPDTLNSALNSSFSGVTGFFENPGSFGQGLSSALNNLGTQAPNGAIYLAQQQNKSEEAALNASVATEDALLASEKATLTAELNSANQILQSIPQQLAEINQIYSATTGYNTNRG